MWNICTKKEHQADTGQTAATVRETERVMRVKRLYIAYGSNLNLDQMKCRCPDAKVYGKGILKGYRLLFKGNENNAYLTIEAKEGGKLPVVIWEIQPSDELALDRYEGYPSFYDKENILVELDTGESVEAMVYIMTHGIKDRNGLNLPSKSYLEAVTEGYESFGFELTYLDKALAASKTRGN